MPLMHDILSQPFIPACLIWCFDLCSNSAYQFYLPIDLTLGILDLRSISSANKAHALKTKYASPFLFRLHYIWNVIFAFCLFWRMLDWSYLDFFFLFVFFFPFWLNKLQISEVVNCMKDLIDYTAQEAGKGPIGKLKETSNIWYMFFLTCSDLLQI